MPSRAAAASQVLISSSSRSSQESSEQTGINCPTIDPLSGESLKKLRNKKHTNKDSQSPRRTVSNNTFFSPEYNFIETRSYKKRLRAALESSDDLILPLPYKYQDPLSNKLKIDLSFFVHSLPPLDALEPMQCVLPLKTRSVPQHALVLDLDETLVHSSLTPNNDAEFTFKTMVDSQIYEVFVRTRPYLSQFIQRLSSKFELILFTASLKEYGDKLMDYLDPEKHIKHRLFRNSCRFVNNNYVKDLSILGRELSRTAIVDNSPQAFGYQVIIPILKFHQQFSIFHIWLQDSTLITPILQYFDSTFRV
ncbi:MAG: CTD small phosphatase-like protein 2, variant 2 [Marteilia pararefringens]